MGSTAMHALSSVHAPTLGPARSAGTANPHFAPPPHTLSRPGFQACVLLKTPEQMVATCDAKQECLAFMLKPLPGEQLQTEPSFEA